MKKIINYVLLPGLLFLTSYAKAQVIITNSDTLEVRLKQQDAIITDLFHLVDGYSVKLDSLNRAFTLYQKKLAGVSIPYSEKLVGTMFSYGGSTNGTKPENVADSNLVTYWDSKESGAYVGWEYPEPMIVKLFGYAPRRNDDGKQDRSGRINGSKLQGSNVSKTEGWEDLYVISGPQPENATEVKYYNMANYKSYKFYRVLFGTKSYGNASEIELWGYKSN